MEVEAVTRPNHISKAVRIDVEGPEAPFRLRIVTACFTFLATAFAAWSFLTLAKNVDYGDQLPATLPNWSIPIAILVTAIVATLQSRIVLRLTLLTSIAVIVSLGSLLGAHWCSYLLSNMQGRTPEAAARDNLRRYYGASAAKSMTLNEVDRSTVNGKCHVTFVASDGATEKLRITVSPFGRNWWQMVSTTRLTPDTRP